MIPNVIVCIPEPRLRSLFSLLLTDAGALVVACPDTEEALRVLTTRVCPLCGFVLGGGGEEGAFLFEASRLSPDTKFLLIANREDVDSVLPLFRKGLSDALLQPINPKRAVAAIQGLLGRERAPAPGEAGARAGAGESVPPFPAEAGYRTVHLTARSAVMRRMVNALWAARHDPIGVILRGEPGSEFELAAREFQVMGGDASGDLVVLNHPDLDVDTLATQVSLDRLNEGLPRTYFVPDIEKLAREQEKPLLEFLRRARRMRDREKPLRMVFAFSVAAEDARPADREFLEELQFILPSVLRMPPLRERRDDIEPIVRRVLTDLTAVFPEYRARSVHPSALQWLVARNWRGNYRELVAATRRAVTDCTHREVAASHFGQLTEEGADAEELAAGRVLAAAQRAVWPR